MPRMSKAKLASDTLPPGQNAALEHGKRGLNGKTNGRHAPQEPSLDVQVLLDALQAVRVGDFSVRLPGDQVGLAGKIADTFNEIVAANERMAQQLEQVGQVVGREGKTRQRVRFGAAARRLGRDGDLGQHADRRSAVADHGGDARDRRGGAGRPAADRAARRRRPAAARASSCARPRSSTR